MLADLRRPRIHYQLRGDENAPAMVILRGLGRSLGYWPERLIERLEPSFLLVLVDNRGVGESDRWRLPYSTAAMADDLAHVLDHARIARAHLFGMSLGGMIAAQFALRHGGRLDRLVLGCTTPGGPRAPRARMLDAWPALSAQLGGDRRAKVEAEARLLLSAPFMERHGAAVVERWLALEHDRPTPRITFALQLLAAARHDVSRRLDRVTADTLVVSSDSDPLVPPDNSRLLARAIHGSELAWLEGLGHDFATEAPDSTADLLLDFVLR